MKGVILAGGKGLRLYPLTKVTNKHLLPVGKEPMIFNPIHKLTSAGISDILIVSDAEQMGSIANLLGSGAEFGCNFTYKAQEAPLGIAHALSLAEDFAKNDKIVVILADNITTGSIKKFVDDFALQPKGAKVLLRKVDNPSRYGIAAIDEHQVLAIEEKPNVPKTNFAVVGYYMYDSEVFNIIRSIKPSSRGEYEITDVNNVYAQRKELTYDFLDGEWTDAGTFESLLFANEMFLKSGDMESDTMSSKVSAAQIKQMIEFHKKKIAELERYLR
jgi:glucose-1-phosphate thymidylyltransferase